ncbi:MAG: oligosaccharide flippase family protein [Candidatus Pacebacteria bacterium]|nr:oligosaccharide flippase family protein [Candidatus Paceibacterota bacterium]
MKRISQYFGNFFGVNMNYLIGGGFWLGLDQIFSAGTSMVLTVAFANLISQEAYGTYRYILSIFGILTIATLPNMNIAVLTSVARGFENLSKALKSRIEWGFIGTIAGFSLAGFYFYQGNNLLGYAFIIMAVFLPFTDSFNVFLAFFRGRKLFREQTLYSIIIKSVSAAALIATLFLTENLLIILLAFFIPYVLSRVFLYWLAVKKFSPNNEVDPNTISYGKNLSLLQFLGFVVNYLDNLLIFYYLGPISLAIYTMAMAPISKFQKAFSILPDLALPKFSERPAEEIKKYLIKRIFKLFIFIIPIVAVYILIAPMIFDFFLPKYHDSIFYTQLLSLVFLCLPFSLIYTFMQSKAMQKQLYIYNISIRIIQLILTVIFVGLYGVMGAVIARLIFQLAATSILFVIFKAVK